MPRQLRLVVSACLLWVDREDSLLLCCNSHLLYLTHEDVRRLWNDIWFDANCTRMLSRSGHSAPQGTVNAIAHLLHGGTDCYSGDR